MSFQDLICKIGWHSPVLVGKHDGISLHGKCENCGKELMQDSQGGWF